MGNSGSTQVYEDTREKPFPNVTATLYYFGGRGKADQIRWLLAATNTTFAQKVVSTREMFLRMAERQLPFAQLPLLQIDGLELVQTQAIIRYIAKRGNLVGRPATSTSLSDETKCDMIAECCNDAISPLLQAPFRRAESAEVFAQHKVTMHDTWNKFGSRFEAILIANGKEFMVGNSFTYADILVVHCMTWYVEECGPEVVDKMPGLIELQYKVFQLPGLSAFIKNNSLYYPLGDKAYCEQVMSVLGRNIK